MISCSQYDFIEIVCMYRYPIKLTLRSDVDITETKGIALDTQQNDKKEECINIEVEGVERLVVLDEISSLEVCIDNPHFNHVSFD